jgi:hypothetical protein
MSEIRIGDFVQSDRHGHKGRVYGFERLNESAADWIRGLRVQPTLEQILGVWVNVLCDDPTGRGHGGAILTPISACTKIPPIEGFYHICGKDHFP